MSELEEKVKGVGSSTAKSLREAGITEVDELAQASPEDIDGVSEKKARKIIDRAGRQTIRIKSGDEVREEYEEKGTVSTGIEELDKVMDGGWEEGLLAALYGPSGTAKTQLIFSALAEAVKGDGKAVYVETERGNYRPERIQSLANEESDQEQVDCVEAFRSLEDQYNAYFAIKEFYDSEEVNLIAVDSLTSQFRGAEELAGRKNLGDRTDEIRKHLNAIGELLDYFDCPVLATGQIYEVPDMYSSGPEMWGGAMLEHEVAYFVQMEDHEGELVQATLENHPGKAEGTIYLNIHESGIEGMTDV